MAPTVARPQPFRFLPLRTLIKALVYSDPIDNEKTLYRPNFDVRVRQTIRKRPGTFQTVSQSMIRLLNACVFSG
jgi:hypothetical protein